MHVSPWGYNISALHGSGGPFHCPCHYPAAVLGRQAYTGTGICLICRQRRYERYRNHYYESFHNTIN